MNIGGLKSAHGLLVSLENIAFRAYALKDLGVDIEIDFHGIDDVPEETFYEARAAVVEIFLHSLQSEYDQKSKELSNFCIANIPKIDDWNFSDEDKKKRMTKAADYDDDDYG